MKKQALTLAVLTFGLMAPQVYSQSDTTINWGIPTFINQHVYDSSGAGIDTSYVWNLGWFNPGFTPDGTNFTSWAANFNVLSTMNYNIDPTSPFGTTYSAATSVNVTPGHPSENQNMYTFAYNDISKIGTEAGEALLIRADQWVWSDPGLPPGLKTWNVDNIGKDGAVTVVWGAIDSAADNNDAGQYFTGDTASTDGTTDWRWTELAPGGRGDRTFSAQFASFTPEPSSTLLMAFGAVSFVLRRRRS